MNSTIYIFGNFGHGNTQYPNDYTAEIFSQFQKRSQSNTQLTIHRNENLMYYGYVRKLHNREQCIGICVVLNSSMFRGVKTLFNRFENYITDMVVRGQIIEFSDNGDLVSKIANLYEFQNEIERITKFIQNDIETLALQKLPPSNLSIGKNESKTFVIDDKAESILEATYNYGYTYIYKDAEYNTDSLTSYSEKLHTLNKEKTAALQTIDKQKQEISNLKKKQKNYKLVIWLVFFICVGGLICFIAIKNKDADIIRLQNSVATQEQTIETQNTTIGALRDTIISRNIKIQALKTNVQNLEYKKDSLIRINRILTTEKNTLTNEKSNLTIRLNSTQSKLNDANTKVYSKDKEIQSLKSEVSKYKYAKKEPDLYKTKNRTICYYKDDNYQYRRTGDYYYGNTTIYVYYTTHRYALTEKGYVLLSDLQKVY